MAPMTPLLAPTLGPRGLQELKNSPKIQIFYRTALESFSELAIESFPRKVATYFSQAIKKDMENRPNTKSSFTLPPGHKAEMVAVFKWMLICCSGSGVKAPSYPPTLDEDLTYLSLAKQLQIPILAELLHSRICTEVRTQLPVEGVKLIYARLPASDPIRQLVAETVAHHIENGGLKHGAALRQFKLENGEYDNEVYEQLSKIRAPRLQAERAARREHNQLHRAQRLQAREEYLSRKTRKEEELKGQIEMIPDHGRNKARAAPGGKKWWDVTKGVWSLGEPSHESDTAAVSCSAPVVPNAPTTAASATTTAKIDWADECAEEDSTSTSGESSTTGPTDSTIGVTKRLRVLSITKEDIEQAEKQSKALKEADGNKSAGRNVTPKASDSDNGKGKGKEVDGEQEKTESRAKVGKENGGHAPVVGRVRKQKKI